MGSACSAISSSSSTASRSHAGWGSSSALRMEANLRRAMRISSGDPMIFINRPISLFLAESRRPLLLIIGGRLAVRALEARGSFQEN